MIRLREEAEQDLVVAASWYERQRIGLGSEFLDEVLAALESVAGQPRMYPVIHRNTRRALMRRFPFGIFYRIESRHVVIVAIMHASRHPTRWQRRDE